MSTMKTTMMTKCSKLMYKSTTNMIKGIEMIIDMFSRTYYNNNIVTIYRIITLATQGS